jgi:hypothetical protein
MRIYVPLEFIYDNPFQSPHRDYSDIAEFATQDIVPYIESRPETMGLQVPPQGRLIANSALVTYSEANKLIIEKKLFLASLPAAEAVPTYADRLRQAWEKTGYFIQLIMAHRRVRAIRYLAQNDERYAHGLIPLDVIQLPNEQMLAEVRTENFARKNQSAVEDLEYMRHAFNLLGQTATLKDVAALLKMSESRARNLWRLRDLPEDAQQANMAGKISQSHCEELLALARIKSFSFSADGSTWVVGKWDGERHNGEYSHPPHPQDYYNYVLTHGDKIGRDDIRRYLSEFAEAAGRELPPALKSETLGDEGEVLQATCKQCPAKQKIGGDEYCLNQTCFRAKMLAWCKAEAQKSFPGYQWVGEKLTSVNNVHYSALIEYALAHRNDPEMLIGVAFSGYATRPLGQSWVHSSSSISFPREILAVAPASAEHAQKIQSWYIDKKNEATPATPKAPNYTAYDKKARDVANRLITFYAEDLAKEIMSKFKNPAEGIALLRQTTTDWLKNVQPHLTASTIKQMTDWQYLLVFCLASISPNLAVPEKSYWATNQRYDFLVEHSKKTNIPLPELHFSITDITHWLINRWYGSHASRDVPREWVLMVAQDVTELSADELNALKPIFDHFGLKIAEANHV